MGYIFQLSKRLLNLFDEDVDCFDDDIDDDDIDDDIDDEIDDDDDDDINDDDIDDNLQDLEPTSEDILNAKSATQRTSSSQNQFPSFMGRKICATRHGCTGATNCDSAYGAPIGR